MCSWGTGWGVSSPPQEIVPFGTEVILGSDTKGQPVKIDLDLMWQGRMLIQAPSGSGKTTLLKRLLSQCAAYMQWVVIDPEGEYGSFVRQRAATPSWRRTPQSPSTPLDISDMTREQQLAFLARFINDLLNVPKNQWGYKTLVMIDEVQLFTPTDTSVFDDPKVAKRCKQALVDLMSLGRKRGLLSVIATHRMAQLATGVRAEARNLIIGGSTFDVDIARAGDLIGWPARKAFEIIPHLPVGCFVCSGPCFSSSPVIVKIPVPE